MDLRKRKYLSQYDGLTRRRRDPYSRTGQVKTYRLSRRPQKASEMSSTNLVMIIIIAALVVVVGIVGYLEYKEYQKRERAREYYRELHRIEEDYKKKVRRIFDR